MSDKHVSNVMASSDLLQQEGRYLYIPNKKKNNGKSEINDKNHINAQQNSSLTNPPKRR